MEMQLPRREDPDLSHAHKNAHSHAVISDEADSAKGAAPGTHIQLRYLSQYTRSVK